MVNFKQFGFVRENVMWLQLCLATVLDQYFCQALANRSQCPFITDPVTVIPSNKYISPWTSYNNTKNYMVFQN
jgi:hypothetical protein